MTTPNLALPLLAAAQAQKHVTVNEALSRLDGLVQISVLDRDLASPPSSPVEGDRYIAAAGATGAWTGWDGDVVLFSGGAWLRLAPQEGWRVWIEDEGVQVVRIGGTWLALDAALNLLVRSAAVEVARGPGGATIRLHVEEELLAGLTGPSVSSTIAIPDRAIVLAVSTRTVTAVTVRVETASTMALSGMAMVEETEGPVRPANSSSSTCSLMVAPPGPRATSTAALRTSRFSAASRASQVPPMRTTCTPSSSIQTRQPSCGASRSQAPPENSTTSPSQPVQAPVAPAAAM